MFAGLTCDEDALPAGFRDRGHQDQVAIDVGDTAGARDLRATPVALESDLLRARAEPEFVTASELVEI